VFQSSPALSSGRYKRREEMAKAFESFNPRPPFRAGATVQVAQEVRRDVVSILARPFERALAGSWRFTPRLHACFTPRPPFRAGATKLDTAQYNSIYVSILARPFERALLIERVTTAAAMEVSILARPFERALHRVRSARRWSVMFQSSPALSSGRYVILCPTVAVMACFNPRPPFRAGATGWVDLSG